MAEPITIQKLIDASIDSDSLETLVNGDENAQVVTRTGETYPSVKKAIYTLFENGGLPAKPFATLAKMNTDGASLVDGKIAIVYNEVANNGLYVKTSGAWVKASYDTTAASKSYTDESIDAIKNAPTDFSRLAQDIDSVLSGTTGSTVDLIKTVSSTAGRFIGASGATIANVSYSYTDYIPVTVGSSYTISTIADAVGAFYDSNKVFLSAIKSTPTAADGLERNFRFKAPANAAFMRINVIKDMQVTLFDTTQIKIVADVQELKYKVETTAVTQWTGKRIYWFGTSIPAASPKMGQQDVWSYANLSTKDVGGIIHNKSVGSSGISSYTEFSFTKLTSVVNYKNALVDMIGTPTAPDLVVFDFGVNDYATKQTDIDAYDPNDPYDASATGTKTKIDSRDVNTFIGAYNTIIDAMLTKSPTVKFCFITHFSDDNAATFITKKANYYAKMNLTIAHIAAYWSAPVLELQKKTGFRNRNGFNSIEPLMPDRIHPASGDGRAVQSLRYILKDFLLTIS